MEPKAASGWSRVVCPRGQHWGCFCLGSLLTVWRKGSTLQVAGDFKVGMTPRSVDLQEGRKAVQREQDRLV